MTPKNGKRYNPVDGSWINTVFKKYDSKDEACVYIHVILGAKEQKRFQLSSW